MSRAISAALITALQQPNPQLFMAVEMLFDTEPLRLWAGFGDRVINGLIFTGSGELLGFSEFEETGDLSARGASITLSGVSSTLVSLALSEPYQGRPARVYFGEQSVTDVCELFAGSMNVINWDDSGEDATFELVIDSKLVRLEQPNMRRYTQSSHQSRFAGDTFFNWVTDIQDRDFPFGPQA
jgi:hypothetical protein